MKIQYNKIFVGLLHLLAGFLFKNGLLTHSVISYLGTVILSGAAWVAHNPPPEDVVKDVRGSIGKLISLLVFTLALPALLLTAGCYKTTLAPGGAYAAMPNGTNAFNADLPIVTIYNELDAFVLSEANNHAWFASNYPAAVSAANEIRANGSNWVNTAVAARNAYVASSSVSNQTVLNNAMAVLQVAVSQATNYVKLKP